jgi:hypothetical protein
VRVSEKKKKMKKNEDTHIQARTKENKTKEADSQSVLNACIHGKRN